MEAAMPELQKLLEIMPGFPHPPNYYSTAENRKHYVPDAKKWAGNFPKEVVSVENIYRNQYEEWAKSDNRDGSSVLK